VSCEHRSWFESTRLQTAVFAQQSATTLSHRPVCETTRTAASALAVEILERHLEHRHATAVRTLHLDL
jgi:hypothetical protein